MFEVTQWRCQISSWMYGLKFRGEDGATDVLWELSAYAEDLKQRDLMGSPKEGAWTARAAERSK